MMADWDPRRGRSGRPWRRLVAQHCKPGAVCAWCGKEIMFGLRPRHPLGPSLDHIIALADGGHPTAPWNLQPMHLGCNVRKENARRREIARAMPKQRPETKLAPLRRRR